MVVVMIMMIPTMMMMMKHLQSEFYSELSQNSSIVQHRSLTNNES